MIIGKGLETLLNEAGMSEFTRKLREVKFEDSKLDMVELASDGSARISFITENKLQRYVDDKASRGFDHLSVERIINSLSYETDVPEEFSTVEFRNRYGTKTKVGRFMRKFFTEQEFTTKMIEKLNAVCNEGCFELSIVEGADITYYYNGNRYASDNGSLGSSCMRYEECEDFFSIYEDNARMLILTPKSNKNTIFGRALLWDNVEVISRAENIKVMDRIYTSSTEYEEMFKRWANSNGYYYKDEQNFSCFVVENNGNKIAIEDDAKISIGREYYEYPYMDTFSMLINNGDLLVSNNHELGLGLRSTDGNRRVVCACCGKKVHYDVARYGESANFPNSEYDEDDRYCTSCWDKLFVYVNMVGTIRKDDERYEYDYCMINNYNACLVKDMLPYKGLDEDGKIKYGRIAQHEITNCKYDEKEGIYYDVRLEKCVFCGEYHEHSFIIYEPIKYEQKEGRKIHSFSALMACPDCIIKNSDKVSLFDRYVHTIGSFQTASAMDMYINTNIMDECAKCGEKYNVLDASCRYDNGKIENCTFICDNCYDKERERIKKREDEIFKVIEQINDFVCENRSSLGCALRSLCSQTLAELVLDGGFTIEQLSTMTPAEIKNSAPANSSDIIGDFFGLL